MKTLSCLYYRMRSHVWEGGASGEYNAKVCSEKITIQHYDTEICIRYDVTLSEGPKIENSLILCALVIYKVCVRAYVISYCHA